MSARPRGVFETLRWDDEVLYFESVGEMYCEEEGPAEPPGVFGVYGT